LKLFQRFISDGGADVLKGCLSPINVCFFEMEDWKYAIH